MEPKLTPLIDSLPSTVPFVGPEALERRRGSAFRARLGANENGFGPAPSVIAAICDDAGNAWKYADPENFELKHALARKHGVDAANIVVGEGVDALLGLAVRQYITAGTTVVTSLGAYPTFNFHVAGFGGRLVTVPYRRDREDLGALLQAVKRENAPLVYFSNPDNPMGTWWEASDVQAFIEALPATTMLILDEAYTETAPDTARPALDISRPNVLRMRTFSKAYGLAGMRCGYAIGAERQIAAFDKVRNHFGVSRIAQAGALAALEDTAWLTHIRTQVQAGREALSAIARAHGLDPLPSATNFVTMDCRGDGDLARRVLQELVQRNIFVRMPFVAPHDRCIRVSVGTEQDIALFAAALPLALTAARA